MKLRTIVAMSAGGLMSLLLTAPAIANPAIQIVDSDAVVNTSEQYQAGSDFWRGSDTNPQGQDGAGPGNTTQLTSSDVATETAWLHGLLDLTAGSAGANAVQPIGAQIQDPQGGGTSLTDFDPGFAWTYVVVKWDAMVQAFQNGGSNNLLTVGPFAMGISHLTFFTPIPAAAWLLLTGVAALLGLRFRRRNGEVPAAA